MATKTKEKKVKENGASIEETLKSIKKRFGDDSVMLLDAATHMDVESIPTGSFGLDLALGVGGVPRGRLIEVFGPESSGKTTLALHTVAEAQKTGGVCAFIDVEHALDPHYAKKIGVVTSELIISQPENGEQALEILDEMVRSNKFAVIVLDSVAALVTKSELEGEMGDQHVGRHPKMMSQAMRKLVGVVSQSGTVVIFINQIRLNIGQMGYGSPEYTPGGKALKFAASVRLDIRRIAQIKKGEEVVGGRVRIKVVKNKVAPPFKQTEFDLLYGEGISREGEIIALGQKYKIIEKKGNTFFYGELKLGVGYDQSRTFLRDNSISADITALILQKIKEDVEPEGDININESVEE